MIPKPDLPPPGLSGATTKGWFYDVDRALQQADDKSVFKACSTAHSHGLGWGGTNREGPLPLYSTRPLAIDALIAALQERHDAACAALLRMKEDSRQARLTLFKEMVRCGATSADALAIFNGWSGGSRQSLSDLSCDDAQCLLDSWSAFLIGLHNRPETKRPSPLFDVVKVVAGIGGMAPAEVIYGGLDVDLAAELVLELMQRDARSSYACVPRR